MSCEAVRERACAGESASCEGGAEGGDGAPRDARSRPPQCASAGGGEEEMIRFRVWMVVVSYIHFILGQAVGLNHGLEVYNTAQYGLLVRV